MLVVAAQLFPTRSAANRLSRPVRGSLNIVRGCCKLSSCSSACEGCSCSSAVSHHVVGIQTTPYMISWIRTCWNRSKWSACSSATSACSCAQLVSDQFCSIQRSRVSRPESNIVRGGCCMWSTCSPPGVHAANTQLSPPRSIAYRVRQALRLGSSFVRNCCLLCACDDAMLAAEACLSLALGSQEQELGSQTESAACTHNLHCMFCLQGRSILWQCVWYML